MHDGHRQRMIKKFLQHGSEALSDHELLEMILYFSIARRDTNEIAHNLITTFGSYNAVLSADFQDLKTVAGIGDHSAVLIKLVQQASKRYYTPSTENIRFKTSLDASRYLISHFFGEANEMFYILCLDMKFRLVHMELIAEGNHEEVVIYPRKIAAVVLRHNASRVILAHNHPTGSPSPSLKDIESTKQITEVLNTLDTELVDHIIVSGSQYYSFRDKLIHDSHKPDHMIISQYNNVKD